MVRRSKPTAANFQSNLNLLLRAKNITQAEFSTSIAQNKTTVNKWILSGSAPSQIVLETISHTYNIPVDMFFGDPDIFGKFLNMSQPEIDEIIKIPSIYLRNIRIPRRDPLLARVVGLYDLFMPSAIYKNMILQRTMRIYENTNHRYYYEVFNLSEETDNIDVPETRFSGSVVISGQNEFGNMILLGGQTTATAGVQFLVFQLPTKTRFKTMSGSILGEVNGQPFTNPVCARPIAEAEPESDIRDYAQRVVYVKDNIFFEQNPDMLRIFGDIMKNSWFAERIKKLASV